MVKTRIAPSPTGSPHIGTLFQGLINYVVAKKLKGHFLVRIEDTDQARFVKGAEKAIFDALDWIGIKPDEPPIRQSERLPVYQKAAEKLIEEGKAYYCFCSPQRLAEVRSKQQKDGLPPMYNGHCRSLDVQIAQSKASTSAHVIRLKVPQDETVIITDLLRGSVKFDSNLVDDQVLIKSDGFPTYHLAVVVDDHDQGITHIIRGEEWLSSSPKLVLLYRFFGYPLPTLIHTPILRNPDRSKLSKRHGHASVSWYQENGYLPEAVINFLATRVWNHPEEKEVFNLDDLISHFDLSKMHLSGPIVDLDKLNWLNGQWLRLLPDETLLPRLESFLPKEFKLSQLKPIWPLIKERLEKLTDLPYAVGYFGKQPQLDTKLILKEAKMSPTETIGYLDKVAQVVENIKTWSVANLETDLHKLQKTEKLKPRPAFMTIRVAVTGQSATPPLFDTLHALGQETTLKRLSYAQKTLKK
jgi:glutamyl-tRNA synthetase